MRGEEKCDKVEKENLRAFHNILLGNLHRHESDLLKFLGILLTSLGGLGLALRKYLERPEMYSTLFNLAVTMSILLLGWGVFFALALSYNHRYIQRVMSKFENTMCFYESNLLPARWDINKRLEGRMEFWGRFFWDIAPSIYRVHIVFFMFGILGICIFSALLIHSSFKWLAVLEGVVIFLSSWYLNYRYWHKLKHLYSQERSPKE